MINTLTYMLRNACAFMVNPEAREVHNTYPNGNTRSIREARLQRDLNWSPTSHNLIVRESITCLILSLVLMLTTLMLSLYCLTLTDLTQKQYTYFLFTITVCCILGRTAIKASKLNQ